MRSPSEATLKGPGFPRSQLSSDPSTWRTQFFALTTVRDLAALLEVEYRLLVWVVFANRAAYYDRFEIPKRSGDKRQIVAPKGSLRILQSKLANILSEVYDRKPPVHGFTKTKSIVTNAQAHRRSNYVLNIDLNECFPTIHFGRVRGMFRGRPYDRPDPVATALAAICCIDDRLPQGAPTSPIVSNMLCGKLDSELLRLAAAYECTYTRYADDITISTRRRTFPDIIASIDPQDASSVIVGDLLRSVIERNGFSINSKKGRLQHRDRRQMVTGLIVNEKPNVPRRLVRQVRSMLHAWGRYGLPAAQSEFTTAWDHRPNTRRQPETSFVDVLGGRIAFIQQVRGADDRTGTTLKNRFRSLLNQTHGLRKRRTPDPYVRRGDLFNALEPQWVSVDANS